MYKNSLMFKMEKDEIKTVKVNYRLPLANEQDVLQLIGRSILLERTNHPDKIFGGHIVPMQLASCKKVINSIPFRYL